MDFEEIKNLIAADGGKFIIVENGKPMMVIIGFEEYKKKVNYSKDQPLPFKKEVRPVPRELESEALKIEDLPL